MYSLLSTDSYTLTQMFKSKEGGGGYLHIFTIKLARIVKELRNELKQLLKGLDKRFVL